VRVPVKLAVRVTVKRPWTWFSSAAFGVVAVTESVGCRSSFAIVTLAGEPSTTSPCGFERARVKFSSAS
jgi:hypothetical protein